MLRDDVGCLAELHRSLIFPFGGDDLRAALAFVGGLQGTEARASFP